MERYVCVGGVEISNPCRTLAYMATIGNACSVGVMNECGCCCEDATPAPVDPGGGGLDAGEFSIDVTRGDTTWDLAFTGAGGLTVGPIALSTLAAGMAPGPICAGGTPAAPPADGDAAWTTTVPAGYPASSVWGNPLSPWVTSGAAVCQLSRLHVTLGGVDVGDMFGVEDETGSALWLAWRPEGGSLGAWVDVTAGGTITAAYGDSGGDTGGGATSDWGGSVASFTTPAADDAPWYDPADPRSLDVLGVWLEEMTLSSPHERQAKAKLWGSALSPARLRGRELTVKGRVYVRSRAGAEYARHWLYEALTNSPCGDTGCNPPDVMLRAHCPIDGGDDGERTLHEVGLTDWKWQLDPAAPYHCFSDFTATMTSKVPWLTKTPAVAHTGLVIPDGSVGICDFCGNAIATGSGACEPRESTLGDLACGCADQPARVIDTPQRFECYAPPTSLVRHYFPVTTTKLWTDGALRLSIQGGFTGDPSEPSLRNLRIRAFANPAGLAASEGDLLLCNADPCIDVQIGCVPYGAVMVIDGSTRSAYVAANGAARSANPYLSSALGRFQWPEYSCGGLMVAVDADALLTATDSTITVETIEVERG